MNPKLQTFYSDDDKDENLFSKVLSGMKSVFNNTKKNKKKNPLNKSVTQDHDPCINVLPPLEILSLDYPNTDDVNKIISFDTDVTNDKTDISLVSQVNESIENESIIESTFSMGEFSEIVSDTIEINSDQNLIPKFDILPFYQDIDQNSYYETENSMIQEAPKSIDVIHELPENFVLPIAENENDNNMSINCEIESILTTEKLEDETVNRGNNEVQVCSSTIVEKQPIAVPQKKKAKLKLKPNNSIGKQKNLNTINNDSSPNDSVISDVVKEEKPKEISPLQSKPRIVLKFRSEKSGARSSNMKIVSDDKSEGDAAVNITNRRSLRGKVPVSVENSPNDDQNKNLRNNSVSAGEVQQSETKSPNINSESDESNKSSLKKNKRSNPPSDSSSQESSKIDKGVNTIKRSARRRSKEFSENVLANAIARKEKIYSETSPNKTRLSRRIKPTAKILANRELRLGLETQNNVRLGLISQQDDGKTTRSSSRKAPEKSKSEYSFLKTQYEKSKAKKQSKINLQYNDKKSSLEESKLESNKVYEKDNSVDVNKSHILSTHTEPVNKESEIKLKLSKAKHFNTSSETEENSEYKRLNKLKKKHLKKLGLKAVSGNNHHIAKDQDIVTDESTMDSTNTDAIIEHLNTRNNVDSSFEGNAEIELQQPIMDFSVFNETKKSKPCKNPKRKIVHTDSEDSTSDHNELSKNFTKNKDEIPCRVTRKRSKICDISSKTQEKKNPKKISHHDTKNNLNLLTCLCNRQSDIFAEPSSISDPEFCRAIENIGGRFLGCGRPINSTQLVRSGTRASFFLSCDMHRSRLALHHCCAGCGVFCTQGIHYQCSEGHLFHWECSLPFVPLLIPPGQVSDQESSLGVDQPAQPRGSVTDLYNSEPGCPHCGLHPVSLEPNNTNCHKVNLEMKCSNPMIFLPNPRLQWVPARMSFLSNPTNINDDTSDETDLSFLPQNVLKSLNDYFLIENSTKSSVANFSVIRSNQLNKDLYDAVCDSENTIEKILIALKSGADVRKPMSSISNGNFLHLAVRELNFGALYIFRTLGLELDAYDNEQRTPLILAVMNYVNVVQDIDDVEDENESGKFQFGNLKKNNLRITIVGNLPVYRKIVDFLIKAGSDLTLKGPNGATILHLAAKHGDAATCISVLNNKSYKARSIINQQDDAGLTPLVCAIENKHNTIARLLLEHGANSMSKDFENNTPIHWAALTGSKAILEDLLNFGSEINIVNVNGDTPLHLSARLNHYSCLVILLARGASIYFKNIDGETPIDCVADDTNECYLSLNINEQLRNIVNSPTIDEKIISNDISNGKESNPIRCLNSVDDEDLNGKFVYITKSCFTVDVNINRKISSMMVCNCKDGCGQINTLCTCTNVSMQSWYDINGKLVSYFDYDDPPMIFECNDLCSCNKSHCINRNIDKGAYISLKILRQSESTPQNSGWGVYADQPITKGSFVCEYVGEILPASLAYHREDDSYLFELETKDILEEIAEPYCIDAKQYGNVSRFINHKCEHNIVPVRVFVDHRDLRFPRIAFFACKDINTDEELGFNYGEKFWNIKSKIFACNCSSPKCRYNQINNNKDVELEYTSEPEDEIVN